jgi:hypothetical protein
MRAIPDLPQLLVNADIEDWIALLVGQNRDRPVEGPHATIVHPSSGNREESRVLACRENVEHVYGATSGYAWLGWCGRCPRRLLREVTLDTIVKVDFSGGLPGAPD